MPENDPQTPSEPTQSDSPQEPTQPPDGAPQTGDPPRNADGTFAQAPAPAEPQRFASDYHVGWMAGRTPDEVATIANQMYSSMVKGGQPPQEMASQQQQQYTHQQMPTQSQAQQADGAWDDMNPQASVDARILAATQQQSNININTAEAMGQMARALVSQSDGDAFQRWGPEIDMELMRLQPAMKTEQNIRLVVDMIRGRHVSELQAEAEQKVRSEYATGDVRADGTTGAPTHAEGVLDLNRQVESPLYKRLLEQHRIDEPTIREAFAKYPEMYAGNTFEEKLQSWIAAANKGDVITEQAFQVGDV